MVGCMINLKDYNLAMEGALTLYHKGHEACPPGYAFGPYIRDHFLLHYVLSGEGTFKTQFDTYSVGPKQAFLIHPNQLTYYQSSYENPWEYIWIGFHGNQCHHFLTACGLTERNPVLFLTDDHFQPVENTLKALCDVPENKDAFALLGDGYLRILLHQLSGCNTLPIDKSTSMQNDYVNHAIRYIHRNYSGKLEIKMVAAFLGLDRSYFSKLFKAETGMSPQAYLDAVRLNHAKDFLANTQMSISTVAYSTGFGDALYFSRKFKQNIGMSPIAFREVSTHL